MGIIYLGLFIFGFVVGMTHQLGSYTGFESGIVGGVVCLILGGVMVNRFRVWFLSGGL